MITALITPPLGVKAFLKELGTILEVRSILASMDINVSRIQLEKWKKENALPRFVHDPLLALSLDIKSNTASGGKITAVEIYLKGQFMGRIELPRDVELVLKKRRG